MNRYYEGLIYAKATMHESSLVLACLKNFEDDFHKNLISADEVQKCIGVINEIKELSLATCAGISAARDLFDEVVSLTKSFEAYSNHGVKVKQFQEGRVNKKF